MIKNFIYRLLERRHYWRYVGFSEITELYISRMLRVLAVTMMGMFVAVYLYQAGFGLLLIALYFAAYFGLRALMSAPASLLVARIGPKHATLISNLLYVPAFFALAQISLNPLVVLIIFGLLQATSVSLYNVSYLVNFSKIKTSEHAGKEIGYMYMFERLTTSLSPVIGGVIAFLFGPEMTLYAASVLFLLAAVPLFFTPEQVKTHQKLQLRDINWKMIRPGMVAQFSIGIDHAVSGVFWSLFLAIAIFGTTSNAVYAQIGALASFTILASIVFARVYGMIIDRRRGRELLRAAVVSDSLVHISRAFVSTPIGAILINVANEAASTGYNMPFMKGVFDMADSLPGYRIVYVSLMEVSAGLGACFYSLIIALIVMVDVNEVHSLQVSFIIASVAVLAIMRHRLPALSKRSLF